MGASGRYPPWLCRQTNPGMGSTSLPTGASVLDPHKRLKKGLRYPVECSSVSFEQNRQATQYPRSWIIWLASIGIFLPYTFGTTGKYVIAPLFLLAIIHLLSGVSQRSRRVMACDVFVLATALWMVVAEIRVTGSLSQATGSDALAFVGTYTVARA